MDEQNNGHNGSHDIGTLVEDEAFKELVSKFGDLTVEPGNDSSSIQQKLGVLQRIITAIKDDLDYRQGLYQGSFDTKDEARLVADAIAERQRYGVSITPILDRVIAQCAVKGGRVHEAVGGVNSHSIFTNRGNGGGAPGWKNRNDSKTIA